MDEDILDPVDFASPPRPDPPHSERAEVRPGLTAPSHDHASLPVVPADLMFAVFMTRDLFAVARKPGADPMYRHLKPKLVQARRRLEQMLAEHPDDDLSAELLAEVRSYLPPSLRGE